MEAVQESQARVKVMGFGWSTRWGRNPYRDLFGRRFIKNELRRKARRARKAAEESALVPAYLS